MDQFEIETAFGSIGAHDEEIFVMADVLHEALESTRTFCIWNYDKIANNLFLLEGLDYEEVPLDLKSNKLSKNQRLIPNQKNYKLTIDTAIKLAKSEQTSAKHKVIKALEGIKKQQESQKRKQQEEPIPRITDEVIESMNICLNIASLFGLTGAEAFISANHAVHQMYGINCIEYFIKAYSDEKRIKEKAKEKAKEKSKEDPKTNSDQVYLTAEQIGEPFFISAKTVNKVLEKNGLQTFSEERPVNRKWRPTELGLKYCKLKKRRDKSSIPIATAHMKWNINALNKDLDLDFLS